MGRYLPEGDEIRVQRYGRPAAVRQKIEALAGRTRIEALKDDVRQEYRSQERWDHLRLSAASLVDAVLDRQEAVS